MNKKKIAIIHDSMNMGGTEKALIYMLEGFDYDRYDVTLWLLNNKGPLQDEIDSRVHVKLYTNETIKASQLLKDYFHQKKFVKGICAVGSKIRSKLNINNFNKNMIYDIQSLPYIDESVYDTVIVYQGLYINLLATAVYRFRALNKIAWIHMRFRHSNDDLHLFGLLYRKMDHIFCVSNDINKHYLHYYRNFNQESSVLYNILSERTIRLLASEQCTFPEDAPFILTVGRVAPEKGQMLIPEIAEKLRNDGYLFKWIVVGTGSQFQMLEKEILERKLESIVILTGSLKNPYPYYKNCMIYVQPSYSEGYCTSTCEAKIFYKPIVATDVSGMREQITDGVTGLIAEVNACSIYEKIKQLLDKPDLMSKFSDNIKVENQVTADVYYKQLYRVLDSKS